MTEPLPDPSSAPTTASTSTDPADPATGRVTRSRALGIVIASGIAAVSAFVIQIAVGRTAPTATTDEFLVFWALLFGVYGVIAGMQNETTRAVGAARLHRTDGARVLPAALVLGGATGALVIATAPLWARGMLPVSGIAAAVVVGVSVIAYACHATLSGALSGLGSWGWFSGLMAGESASRLGLCLIVLVVGAGLLPLEVAVALPAGLWLLLAAGSPVLRRGVGARADVPLGRLLRNHAFAILSSASSAALITGFPVLMKATSPDADAAVRVSTVFAISLTRSPIMIPLQAFQGVAITSFLRAGGHSLRALLRPAGAVLALGVVGALAAALLGPWLIQVLFAGRYAVAPLTFAGLMIAAATLALLTLTGTAAIAVSAHRGYTGGWILASVSAFALLLLPLELTVRTVVALVCGPLVGVAVHVLAIRAAAARTAAEEDLADSQPSA